MAHPTLRGDPGRGRRGSSAGIIHPAPDSFAHIVQVSRQKGALSLLQSLAQLRDLILLSAFDEWSGASTWARFQGGYADPVLTGRRHREDRRPALGRVSRTPIGRARRRCSWPVAAPLRPCRCAPPRSPPSSRCGSRQALFDTYHPRGANGQPDVNPITETACRPWGGENHSQAYDRAGVFLVL